MIGISKYLHYKMIKLKNKIRSEEFDPNNLDSVADGVVAEGCISRGVTFIGVLEKEKDKMTPENYYVIYDSDLNRFRTGIWKVGENNAFYALSADEYVKEISTKSGNKRKR